MSRLICENLPFRQLTSLYNNALRSPELHMNGFLYELHPPKNGEGTILFGVDPRKHVHYARLVITIGNTALATPETLRPAISIVRCDNEESHRAIQAKRLQYHAFTPGSLPVTQLVAVGDAEGGCNYWDIFADSVLAAPGSAAPLPVIDDMSTFQRLLRAIAKYSYVNNFEDSPPTNPINIADTPELLTVS